jgi:hypothetical protein
MRNTLFVFFVRTRALFFKGLSSSSFFFIPTFHKRKKDERDICTQRALNAMMMMIT